MTWTSIICHHSASSDHEWLDTNDIEFWHTERGWRRIGYHRIVENVSGIYRGIIGRPAYMTGSHCKGWNSTALGVCFVGNFEEDEMPPEQLEVGAEVVAELCLQYGIPPESIWLHKECGQTLCPGRLFPKADLVKKVRARIQEKEV